MPKPDTVRQAVRLIWVSAGLSALGLLLVAVVMTDERLDADAGPALFWMMVILTGWTGCLVLARPQAPFPRGSRLLSADASEASRTHGRTKPWGRAGRPEVTTEGGRC